MTPADFLAKFRPAPWTLVAIPPDQQSVHAKYCTTQADAAKWIESRNALENIYFHVNPSNSDSDKKGSKTDIEQVVALHVDIDPRVGETTEECSARSLAALRGYSPPPSLITFSGGGHQGFWFLSDPIQIGGDVAKAEEAAQYNRAIEIALGGDHCHNVDRIMRLPGTWNLPNAKKRAAGRQKALSSVVEWHEDRVYPLSLFHPAPKVQGTGGMLAVDTVEVSSNIRRITINELDKFPDVREDTKIIIVQGDDPNKPDRFESRSEALFHVTTALVRARVPNDTIFSIITDPEFAISKSVLATRGNKDRYALRQIQRAMEVVESPFLEELNSKYAVVADIGGKCRVITEVQEDDGLNRSRLSKVSFADFKNIHMNRKVVVGPPNTQGVCPTMPLGHWWLEHPMRKQFDRITFAPQRDVRGAYNLWQGYACDPVEGDCSLFLQHIMDNLANGDTVIYDYILGWMALAVQQPASQGHTAIVLRGRQGTGKGVFASEFGKLFGRHFIQISNSSHLCGNFNAHLRDAVVVFADEAYYAGDKRGESVLKTLITESRIVVEAKGIDSEMSANYTHIIMASNYEWVIPANADERRYLVLDVSATNMQNKGYFRAILDQMNNGGQAALLHLLLHYDLSNFEVRDVPKTTALQQQKIESLHIEAQWLMDRLLDGYWCEEDPHWHEQVDRSLVYENYVEYAKRISNQRLKSQVAITRMLDVPVKRVGTKSRKSVYLFPSLDVMREKFDAKFGGPFDWGTSGEQVEM